MHVAAQFAVVSAISLAAAGATWLAKGAPKSVSAKTVHCDPALIEEGEICLAEIGENVLWVDARPRAEWEENGLEGSVLWNLDPKEDSQSMEGEVAMAIATVQPEMVVVYCGSEACGTSKQIAERIRAIDLGPPVKALHGGWDAISALDSNPAR